MGSVVHRAVRSVWVCAFQGQGTFKFSKLTQGIGFGVILGLTHRPASLVLEKVFHSFSQTFCFVQITMEHMHVIASTVIAHGHLRAYMRFQVQHDAHSFRRHTLGYAYYISRENASWRAACSCLTCTHTPSRRMLVCVQHSVSSNSFLFCSVK